ncbi:MAG: DUF1015 domain-containing protein [Candidatus Rokubacteria bacterium]|nr:DUF1015 domain-containing protein [Candidatus Rokubacteria bacterium]MBI3826852.1 DUF1015 domain-containing protein [Candidatus Rokubacteria bacterium]
MRVKPFRGYRYGIGRAFDLSKVVAPPYDQISPERQQHLLAMSPDNIVRVTLPEERPGEPPGAPYGRARAVLERWLAGGVWSPEEVPAIYPYHQIYAVNAAFTVTRMGFVALGEVSDYAEGGAVLPHERTHAGPKQDRMRLLEATGADVGLLFMLASDPDGALGRAMTPASAPLVEARDLQGERHRLWRVIDEDAIRAVVELMASRSVIIADGHHRYETAVEYARRHPGARDKLMAFFPLEGPGLTILPNHRLVHGVVDFSLERLVRDAAPCFDARPLHDPERFIATNTEIGVVTAQGAAVLSLRPDGASRIAWPDGTSAAWRSLAVSILHEGLLRPWLTVTEAKLDARTHVDYTADQDEAIALARAGRYQAAFLIAPTTPDELQAVIRGGELLPQKSTHFYPKLLDGLVFHRLEPPS